MPEYYKIKGETLTNIADAIREKIGNGGGQITPLDMPTEIASIESGTSITDGIIVTSRDASGYPLTAEMYCATGIAPPNHFFPGYNASSWDIYTNGYWKNLQTLTVMDKINTLKAGSFSYLKADIIGDFSEVTTMPGQQGISQDGAVVFTSSGIREIELDSVQYLCGQNFAYCSSLESVYAPKCLHVWSKWDATASRATFGNCTALTDVQLGSVGYSCTLENNQIFLGCTNQNLVVTIYTKGANVDTQVSRIRNGATNATIIIKASEETTYNGTTYNAGDTILTSEVTS